MYSARRWVGARKTNFMDYLKRYEAGEHKVWDELVSLAPEQLTSSDFHDECNAVAEAIMVRVRSNLDTLRSTMISAGATIEPEGSPLTAEAFQVLTDKFGPLPISFEVFCRTIGSIALTPAKTKAAQKNFVTSLFEGVGIFPKAEYDVTLESDGISLAALTPLRVQLFSAADIGAYIEEYETSDECEDGEPFDLPFCADFFGGTPYAVELPPPTPEDKIDPVVQGYRYSLSFVNYLRHHFKWGGFPGLDVCEQKDDDIDLNLRVGFKNVKGDWRSAYQRLLLKLRKDLVEF